jgi:hypothetical protein
MICCCVSTRRSSCAGWAARVASLASARQHARVGAWHIEQDQVGTAEGGQRLGKLGRTHDANALVPGETG